MGIRQRREREKLEVRQGILQAARELALHEGWQAVTIRRVAERVEYSPSMIYEYFANKEAMLLELHSEGFQLLALEIRKARATSSDQEERLLAMGEAYWEFALRYPELYEVMYGLHGAPLDCTEKPAGAQEAFALTIEALHEWSRSRGIELLAIDEVVEIFLAFLHGLVCLRMEKYQQTNEAHTRHLLRRGIHQLLISWSLAPQQ